MKDGKHPNPNTIHPIAGYDKEIYVKPTITNPNIIVGDFTYIADSDFESHVSHLYEWNDDKLIIGKFCQIAAGVEFVMNGANHQMNAVSTFPFYTLEGWEMAPPAKTDLPLKGDTVIENDVWIGQNSVILPGVHIGDGAIIGANSVVGSDVPPYTKVVGNPARAIQKRFDDELIELLLRFKWWDRSIDEINRLIPILTCSDLDKVKAEIKKLAAMIARTVPAIAEGLEKLRSRVMIFCYQLSHIRSGKAHIQKSLAVWKPELERYTGLVQQIKEKSKERKALVAEKKELPIYHVKRHKALTVRIAELIEDLEELRSEKALLLQKFEYAEDAGAEAFRKDIAIMEAGLKKLEAQEQKYSAELDKVLAEYAELKAQAVDLDPVELHEARNAIRPVQEKEVEQQLEGTMHEKPSLIMLLSAKQETSRLLGEDAENRQARQMIMRRRSTEQLKRSHLKTDRCKIER